MANFYLDNDDIRFLFRYYDMRKLADLMEGDYTDSQNYQWAPENADDAVDNYDRLLDTLGEISGDFIAPRAEGIDQEGNHLNEDGTVTYSKGMQENLARLKQAEVMGFTLPYQYGGLNCPNLIYTIATEIVSRADAALMNIFGLQGIAETINAFASDEIKQAYLPDFCEGLTTGAMVLTEPDAGSDLQAVKLRAHQDANGQWYLNGVKRFITNGCGEVLLTLARSEPDRSGGLGLSLFVNRRDETVRVRRLENKLGIHGSPTCELIYKNTPCELIGERQRGLVTYVMSLMNGARVGIAAQSLGIAEAAYRVARDYGFSRKQFGMSIENFPAVRELLVDMKIEMEVSRSLTYETCWAVDHMVAVMKKLEGGEVTDKEQVKALKQESKRIKRLADMLTPLSKYHASEMCNSVCYDAMQVLGGSGYMKDYPVERLTRDARITTIYEGTSQLQIVAGVRGVCNGTAEKYLMELETFAYPQEVRELADILVKGREEMVEAIHFVKEQPGTEYMDLYGRKIVDVAIMLVVGHLFLQQSCGDAKIMDAFSEKPSDNSPAALKNLAGYRAVQQHKRVVANRYIHGNGAKVTMLCKDILRGDRSTISEYEVIAGPVPEL